MTVPTIQQYDNDTTAEIVKQLTFLARPHDSKETTASITFQITQEVNRKSTVDLFIGETNTLTVSITLSESMTFQPGTFPKNDDGSYSGKGSVIFIRGWDHFMSDLPTLTVSGTTWKAHYYSETKAWAFLPAASQTYDSGESKLFTLDQIKLPSSTPQQTTTMPISFFNLPPITTGCMPHPVGRPPLLSINPAPGSETPLTRDVTIAPTSTLPIYISYDKSDPYTDNSYTFSFINSTNTDITGNSDTQIQFTLLTGVLPGASEMAESSSLSNPDYYNIAVTQNTSPWKKISRQELGGNYTWIYKLKSGQDTLFPASSTTAFEFSNMVTFLAPKTTALFIQWQNISGYADGSTAIPITKAVNDSVSFTLIDNNPYYDLYETKTFSWSVPGNYKKLYLMHTEGTQDMTLTDPVLEDHPNLAPTGSYTTKPLGGSGSTYQLYVEFEDGTVKTRVILLSCNPPVIEPCVLQDSVSWVSDPTADLKSSKFPNQVTLGLKSWSKVKLSCPQGKIFRAGKSEDVIILENTQLKLECSLSVPFTIIPDPITTNSPTQLDVGITLYGADKNIHAEANASFKVGGITSLTNTGTFTCECIPTTNPREPDRYFYICSYSCTWNSLNPKTQVEINGTPRTGSYEQVNTAPPTPTPIQLNVSLEGEQKEYPFTLIVEDAE